MLARIYFKVNRFGAKTQLDWHWGPGEKIIKGVQIITQTTVNSPETV